MQWGAVVQIIAESGWDLQRTGTLEMASAEERGQKHAEAFSCTILTGKSINLKSRHWKIVEREQTPLILIFRDQYSLNNWPTCLWCGKLDTELTSWKWQLEILLPLWQIGVSGPSKQEAAQLYPFIHATLPPDNYESGKQAVQAHSHKNNPI